MMSGIPMHADCETLRDYFEWHVQNGRGKQKPVIDRRGLAHFHPEKHETVGVGIPPSDETFNPATGRVFVRMVF